MNENDAETFLGELGTPEAVITAAKDRSRILFESGDHRPAIEQLKEYIDKWTRPMGVAHPGRALLTTALRSAGRMRQINYLVERSRLLGGTPIIEAPTSWQYFQWKTEYDSERIDVDGLRNLHLARGLQSATGQMSWLGKVPANALIEIRRQDALPQLRAMLSEGTSTLVAARPTNFHRTSDQVIENIEKAFDEHRRRVHSLKGRMWTFAGVELAGCLAHGAIEIASACGVPFISLINSVIDQAGDLPKLKELPKRFRNLSSERRDLDRSPVGILFRYAK